MQKALARAGFGSRRACEELIRAGRVQVNGKRIELGARVLPEEDVVTVDGTRVPVAADLVYIALHKPTGVITTVKDPAKRRTVLELVPSDVRVFPVGRLDIDTSGLLLMTNDGDFANRIAHPRYGVPKTYVAEVYGAGGAPVVRKLLRGVELEDGQARVESARVQASSRDHAIVELTVHEGRNRIVRRMLEGVGVEVRSLVRISIGGVRLGRLKEGAWRTLKPTEVRDLLALSQHLD